MAHTDPGSDRGRQPSTDAGACLPWHGHGEQVATGKDTDRSVHLAFDQRRKDTGRTTPRGWPAPEFGHDVLLATAAE